MREGAEQKSQKRRRKGWFEEVTRLKGGAETRHTSTQVLQNLLAETGLRYGR